MVPFGKVFYDINPTDNTIVLTNDAFIDNDLITCTIVDIIYFHLYFIM